MIIHVRVRPIVGPLVGPLVSPLVGPITSPVVSPVVRLIVSPVVRLIVIPVRPKLWWPCRRRRAVAKAPGGTDVVSCRSRVPGRGPAPFSIRG